MTTITLTGTYAAGYALASPVSTLSITATGLVGGQGVSSPAAATASYQVFNDGRIEAAAYLEGDGVVLARGGGVFNGRDSGAAAVISGFDGVDIAGGRGKVANFGTIEGVYGHGVSLGQGGSVTNGSNGDASAMIMAYDMGVVLAGKSGDLDTLSNFGTIATRENYAGQLAAVYLHVGGVITNGSKADTAASITGYYAVRSQSSPVTLANFGTIAGSGSRDGAGALLAGGGVLTNGSETDLGARIVGGVGSQAGALTLVNFATIAGSASHTARGASFGDGGSLTNGANTDLRAAILGGVSMSSGVVANFGRMVGYANIDGLDMGGVGSSIVNGSSIATHALIEGFRGIYGGAGPVTITNFGTIWGREGGSIGLRRNTSGRLVVEAGSAFVGEASLGDGTLELAGGAGVMTAFRGSLASYSLLTISGSMAKSSFDGFGVLQIDRGAQFAIGALLDVASGLTVQSAGTLSLTASGASLAMAAQVEATGNGVITFDASVANTGVLIADGGSIAVTGAVAGAGTATIVGAGSLDFGGAASQAVTFSGPGGTLELGDSQAFTGTVVGFSGIGKTSLDLDDIAFFGPAQATFSGTATGGVLTVADGTHVAAIALIGDYLKTAFVTSSDGHGGVLVIGGRKGVATLQHFIQAAAAVSPSDAAAPRPAPDDAPRAAWLAAPRAASA